MVRSDGSTLCVVRVVTIVGTTGLAEDIFAWIVVQSLGRLGHLNTFPQNSVVGAASGRGNPVPSCLCKYKLLYYEHLYI